MKKTKEKKAGRRVLSAISAAIAPHAGAELERQIYNLTRRVEALTHIVRYAKARNDSAWECAQYWEQWAKTLERHCRQQQAEGRVLPLPPYPRKQELQTTRAATLEDACARAEQWEAGWRTRDELVERAIEAALAALGDAPQAVEDVIAAADAVLDDGDDDD